MLTRVSATFAGFQAIAGLLCIQGRARSIFASDSNSSSSPSRAINWTPIGNPLAEQCSVTLFAGCPVWLAIVVNGQ
jgi:hypothetical protein